METNAGDGGGTDQVDCQKELLYNRLLPYSERLDDEANRLLEQTRLHFAQAVILKELKPGCAIWTARLIKYIKLYGLKFTKKCHIELIRLVYELIIVPDLEPSHLHKFCTLLILLTKKVHLISPEELTVPWRPLYEIGKKLFSKSVTAIGMYHYPSRHDWDDDDDYDDDDDDDDDDNDIRSALIQYLLKDKENETPKLLPSFTQYDYESLENTFGMMVLYIKPYFPPNATREILDEFLPRFTPWHSPNQETIQDLVLYLPYQTLPKYQDHGYKLWLDDFMQLWSVCHNGTFWETDIMALIANLAFNNVGRIDWEPHMSLMFTKFLRSFNLPVFYKHTQNNKQHSIDTSSMSLWIVSILGPNSSAQNYLDNFMTTVATYLHGVNSGRWSMKLRDLLRKLPMQFVHRLHRERSTYKKTWELPTAESHKLTPDDITRFVECLLDVALQAMFSLKGTGDACIALQHLALLKPEMVIPPIIEKMWSTLDSLTEPHKLTCAMQSVIAVARPLASGFDNGYPEGPTHIIPLLLSCLPGLDPNDFKKTLVTLHFISVFCNLVLIVDCSGASEYWSDLTENEQTVCAATAQFEDFVLQYFDKVFVLIESSSMEHTRMEQKEAEAIRNKLESTSEGVIGSTSITILIQCSTVIFKMALKKVFNFVTQRILETNVAGLTAAAICRAFSRVNPQETFKMFIPHLCETIESHFQNDDIFKQENLDKDLLFNMLLLSQVVEKNGKELVPYIPKIIGVFDKTIRLPNKEGYNIVCTTIKYIITCLSTVYPEKCRSSKGNYDAHVKDFLAIREWGKPGDIHNCDLKWHIPTKEEVQCVELIVRRYLTPELNKLNEYIDGKISLTREELNKSLAIVKVLLAANPLMPPWDTTTVQLVESGVPWECFHLYTGIEGSISMPDGSNIRKVVSHTMHALQAKLLNSNEDDTKSLCKLAMIWESLTVPNNNSTTLYETHLKIFNTVKRTLEDKLVGRVGHLRVMLADRALLQHEFRMQAISGPITVTQSNNMKAIFELATSRYSEVRTMAQCRLNWIVSNFAYSYKIIVPNIVECLASNSDTEHDRLKGVLFCVLGPKQSPIIAKHEWVIIGSLWPALIHSNPSEKPSVIRLLDSSVRSILSHFPTITIHLKWSDACIERGKALLSPEQLSDPDFISKIKKRDETSNKLGKENEEAYFKLLDVILQGAASTNLHWRHSLMCVSLLPSLVHLDVPYPPRAINLILKSLIHDSILVRKLAIKLTVYVLKQRKKSHKRQAVEYSYLTGFPSEDSNKKCIPGYRPDNAWLQYDPTNTVSEEEWNNSPYFHNEFFGFSYYSKSINMYAPPKEQPEYNFDVNELDESELEIYNFFTNQEYMDKLIDYLSMEDKKGKDKFATFRCFMFKGLFINFVDAFLPIFVMHLKRLVSEKHEALHRCASEILAGLIRGTKHWPFEKVENMKIQITPILKTLLETMTIETLNDWGICFATIFENTNISRLGWILKILEDNIFENANSSQLCGRLFLIQVSILQHPWRLANYSNHLLQVLQDKGMLAHPYQNVRDRVASLLSYIFEKDVTFSRNEQNIAPNIANMIQQISPQLDLVLQDGMKGVTSINQSLLPIAKLAEDNNHTNNSACDNLNNHKVNVSAADKLKCLIKDSISKNNIVLDNINMGSVNKLIQDVKKSNLYQSGDIQEIEIGNNSTLEEFVANAGFLDTNDDKLGNVAFMNTLGDKIISILNISNNQVSDNNSAKDTEYDINIRLFKTILKWITLSIFRYPWGIKSSYYTLLPVACVLGNREDDEELYALCAAFLSCLAESLHDLDQLNVAFKTIQQVIQFPSWCARVSCLSFIQSLVFHNMALVINSDLKTTLRQITLELISDSSVEVREAAAVMFAGLLHCGVLTDIPELMNHFKTMCDGGKVKKGPNRPEALARRHCGVLGLCAFIAAQPYTVPSYLPEIFLILRHHINDPMPIPATIRKTLGDFKRTHHDDWQAHQLKFTEDEISLLNDLTVPPSYYA